MCAEEEEGEEEWRVSAGTKQRARASISSNTELGMVEGVSEREEERGEPSLSEASCSEGEESVTDEVWDFLEEEAEEVMVCESSDGDVEWSESGESGEEEEEEEEGFVEEDSRESSHQRAPEPDASEESASSDNGEAADLDSGGSTSDGSVSGSELEESDGLPGHLRWKEGLAQKAEQGFQRRQTSTAHLQKLIYSDSILHTAEGQEREEKKGGEGEGGGEVGGLFHVAKREQLSVLHNEDSSRPSQQLTRDWRGCVAEVKRCLFVTGDWGDEDAATLLRGDLEEYGDFEDLETRERFGHPADDDKEEEELETRLKKKKEQKVWGVLCRVSCVGCPV